MFQDIADRRLIEGGQAIPFRLSLPPDPPPSILDFFHISCPPTFSRRHPINEQRLSFLLLRQQSRISVQPSGPLAFFASPPTPHSSGLPAYITVHTPPRLRLFVRSGLNFRRPNQFSIHLQPCRSLSLSSLSWSVLLL